jgi:hypothetical protein
MEFLLVIDEEKPLWGPGEDVGYSVGKGDEPGLGIRT